MKIITNDAAYVQKNDIAYLTSFDSTIPASIFLKLFGNSITIIDDSNRYDFVKFEKESEIEYFEKIDWMIDYNEVKDLNEDEIIKKAEKIMKEREEIATTFNSIAECERKYHNDMVTKCDLLEFKIYSLRDFLWFKQGYIPMELPEGIDYPEGYVQENDLKKSLKKKK